MSPATTATRPRDHTRARVAFVQVRDLPDAAWEDYRTMAMKLPALVHAGGLATALHFVAARRKAAQRQLLDHLAAHLADAGLLPEGADAGALLADTRDADLVMMRRQTHEVLRCLAWIRRCLQADAASRHSPTEEE